LRKISACSGFKRSANGCRLSFQFTQIGQIEKTLDKPPVLAYSKVILVRKSSRGLKFLSCYVLAALFTFGWQTATKTRRVAPGWMVSPDYDEDFEVGVDHAVAHSGKASTYIKSKPHATEISHATIGQRIKADAYRGKRVRLSGFLKTMNVTGRARLWMRIDSAKGIVGQDAMNDRALKGTNNWSKLEIVLDVPEDSAGVIFGLRLNGAGQVWMDDLRWETVESGMPTTIPGNGQPASQQLTEEQLNRILQGYVEAPLQPVNMGFEH
jgi:hypothetical protein